MKTGGAAAARRHGIPAEWRRRSVSAPAATRPRAAAPPAQRFLERAVHGLRRRFPDESAATGLTAGQRRGLAAAAALLGAGGVLAPFDTLRALAGVAVVVFFLIVGLRLIASINLLAAPPSRQRRTRRIADSDLPVYTVLVPLFREHRMLPALIHSLARLDYPAAKLDIKLILESVDAATLAAARALPLPRHFECVIVPDAGPRTKPKALNYALQFARGEFVVIYDAEDQPEAGQLREALAVFRAGPANLACVQARLNFYNARENWLTRQFAIEYAALFDGLLPALQRLDLPIPLGGTSNHFRMAALRWLGAWDAFNVTEDADLGMRLYRRGYVCRMLRSATQEEATRRPVPWLRQRTRWLKGFMQTWSVHMRHPLRLWRELGTPRFLGFQIVVFGQVFSALAHPLFYLFVAIAAASDTLFLPPDTLLGVHLWLVALFNVALGYLANMALALLALRRRGLTLAPHIPFMPVCWLGVSLAAYRALFQLWRAPFYWEKTEHGLKAGVQGAYEGREKPAA